MYSTSTVLISNCLFQLVNQTRQHLYQTRTNVPTASVQDLLHGSAIRKSFFGFIHLTTTCDNLLIKVLPDIFRCDGESTVTTTRNPDSNY